MKKLFKKSLAAVVLMLLLLLMYSCNTEKTDEQPEDQDEQTGDNSEQTGDKDEEITLADNIICVAVDVSGNLVVAYKNGTVENVARITDKNSVIPADKMKVKISPDGYWTINNKNTAVKAIDKNGGVIRNNLSDFEFTLKDDSYTVKARENFSLENVVIPAEYKGLPVTAVEIDGFRNKTTVKNLIVADSVKTFENRCFEGCTNLENVVLGSGVKKLQFDVFKDCGELKRIVIGENIESIFDTAFLNCKKLKTVNINDIVNWCGVLLNARPYSSLREEYSGSPFTYGADLYQYGEKVEKLVIPEEALMVGNGIFANCTSIKSVEIPRISSLGDTVFRSCPNLTDVKIGETPSIGSGDFENCTALENVDLGNYLTLIDLYAFRGCTKIKSISFPETLETINDMAFENCTGLESINTPERLFSIGIGSFRGCTSIKSVTLGQGLKVISQYCFQDCDAISVVNYTGSETEWNKLLIEELNEPLTEAEKNFNYQR